MATCDFRVETIGDCTLYLGDCMDVMAGLPKVDAVVTDPPYGIGFPYSTYDDSEENLHDLVGRFMPHVLRLATRAVVTPGISNLHCYPKPAWTAAWTWDTTATYGSLGYSQWQPILFYGNDLKGFGNINGVLKSDRIHFTGGSAKFTQDTDGAGHTCPKPEAFMLRLVGRFSWEGETILDPFMGSGTTGAACAKLGRKFIGIEMDAGYFDIACRRIEKAHAQPACHAGGADWEEVMGTNPQKPPLPRTATSDEMRADLARIAYDIRRHAVESVVVGITATLLVGTVLILIAAIANIP